MTDDKKQKIEVVRSQQEIDDDRKTETDLEDELEQGLRDTFPASDPVSVSQPTTATPSKSDRPMAKAGDKTRAAAINPRSRVNVSEENEVQYWTERFGVSEDKLKEAVRTVGFFPRDVADYLGKSF
ncbi:DUF3606 domain-containing protein [uncultured Ferrovibrio sp.]|jgi:hypothetical protein|uniref:DUF3606 domain-containing protein n=1 Tax=uncultured Ferrovibrio sp. TaxID=1576913 RepID=UPI002613E729|nr:DUF3606 domain-containing protein [uncultured Ferrovibrio sp.]